jgi:tRNA dimethylallyltransferase
MTYKSHKKLIVVGGPTAVGKTAVAIELASCFKTEIISADSRQCYKELNIGVARPSELELNSVIHHFIASHSIEQDLSVQDFVNYALDKLNTLFATHDVVVLVGGTGLYIKALLEGLDQIPTVDPEIRAQISKEYEEKGLAFIQEKISLVDPVFAAQGEMQNPQRIMRALEIFEQTGSSIFSFQKGEKAARDFDPIIIGLDLPREILHERINLRVDQMMEQGLLEEVKSLISYRQKNALQTVGYKELFAFLDGTISLGKAVEEIKAHTRQYARRQLTWFRKVENIQWFEPNEVSSIVQYVKSKLD